MANSVPMDFSGSDTEHIYIGDEFSDQPAEPEKVIGRKVIRNRVNGVQTELTLFEEGYLKVRQGNRKKIECDHLLELKFLAAEPDVTRHLATRTLWGSLAVGLVALLASFILPGTGLAAYSFSVTAALSTLAVLGLMFFVYRSEVTYRFCTASGRTVVLTLTGSFGCIRSVRKIAGRVEKAIAMATSGYDANDVRYLRAEMKVHYRLAEIGVISREACSDGTSMILSKFG